MRTQQWSRHLVNRFVLPGLAILLFSSTTASAKDPLGKTWNTQQQVSMDQIDHSDFDALLKKHVNEQGQVDYAAWHSSESDWSSLRSYLNHLSQASPQARASREAQLAFWINAYNAVTIEGILQEYPTSSIRNHTSKVGYSIWDDLPLYVGNKTYSLNDIEHKILRKMNEPRIHFAIVCASIGCPRLLNEAYSAKKLEQQLATNAKHFFAQSQNLRVDQNSKTLYLSALLDWFGGDFGRNSQAQLRYLSSYMPQTAVDALRTGRYSIKYLDYDWNLNEQK